MAHYYSTGPKTVFFWAPLMKWCLVAAGVSDLKRPAEKLSVSQNLGAPPDGIACEMPSLTRPTITVRSFIRHRLHMGTIFDGHYPNQLQSWSRECKPDLILDILLTRLPRSISLSE
jgi:Mitochondrial pyruvate carriers